MCHVCLSVLSIIVPNWCPHKGKLGRAQLTTATKALPILCNCCFLSNLFFIFISTFIIYQYCIYFPSASLFIKICNSFLLLLLFFLLWLVLYYLVILATSTLLPSKVLSALLPLAVSYALIPSSDC